MVRMHNIEHEYYRELATAEKSLLRKFYFSHEAAKLERWESILGYANTVAGITESDVRHFSGIEGVNAFHLPAFHRWNNCISLPGRGTFALYHANLSVPENSEAVRWLVKEAIPEDLPLIIAGKNPDQRLQSELSKHRNLKLIANPNEEELLNLMQNAQLHLIPALAISGFKLKLINALYSGRFILCSKNLQIGDILDDFISKAGTAEEWKKSIRELMNRDFDSSMKENRESTLRKHYSNASNVQMIVDQFSRIQS